MPTGKKENIEGEDFSEDFIMDNVYQARNRREFSNGRFVKDNLIEKN